jgi:hypothetical protein
MIDVVEKLFNEVGGIVQTCDGIEGKRRRREKKNG